MNNRLTGSCKSVMYSRDYTDFRANCEMNEELKAMFGSLSSSEYRMALQRHGCNALQYTRQRMMDNSQNPTGCKCNYNHAPHDRVSQMKYSWTPSVGFLAEKNKDFNRPISAPSSGAWTSSLNNLYLLLSSRCQCLLNSRACHRQSVSSEGVNSDTC